MELCDNENEIEKEDSVTEFSSSQDGDFNTLIKGN